MLMKLCMCGNARRILMIIEEIVNEIRVEPYPYTTSYQRGNFKSIIQSEFKTRDGSDIVVELFADEDGDLTITFDRDGDYAITGAGDQFRILFTVKDVIERHLMELVNDEKLDVIQVLFSADLTELSRVKLYKNRLSPIISRLLGSEWTGPTIEYGPDARFVWSKRVG